MAATQKQIDRFVNQFIYDYLSRDIEFSDIYENEDTEGFTDKQLRETHDKIMKELLVIRKQLFTT